MLMPLGTGISAAAGAAAVLAAAAGVFAYAAMVPSSQFFGHTLIAPRNKPGGPGELALTFDDGPNPACTPRLLDVLAAHNVRATFFMIGSFAEREPALVRRVHDAGHLIGDHSWSHPNLALTAAAKVAEELTRTIFLPPRGGWVARDFSAGHMHANAQSSTETYRSQFESIIKKMTDAGYSVRLGFDNWAPESTRTFAPTGIANGQRLSWPMISAWK